MRSVVKVMKTHSTRNVRSRGVRSLFFLCGVATFVLTFSISERTGTAQSPYDFSRTPAISPWVSIGNRPTGVLDSFNQYVRPQLEMRRAFETQQAEINRQAATQQYMMRQATQTNAARAAAPPLLGQRRSAAAFRNYMHYYPRGLRKMPQ